MSAYKHALHLSSTERGPKLQLATELLAEGKEVVVLDGTLALRPEADKILCEVISAGSVACFLRTRRGQARAACCLLNGFA
jgi:hypothetical protein